jgi:hypothetical protein
VERPWKSLQLLDVTSVVDIHLSETLLPVAPALAPSCFVRCI